MTRGLGCWGEGMDLVDIFWQILEDGGLWSKFCKTMCELIIPLKSEGHECNLKASNLFICIEFFFYI